MPKKKKEVSPFADLPQGLGMALARNGAARSAFDTLSPGQRADLLCRASRVQSRQEMQSLVSCLESGRFTEEF